MASSTSGTFSPVLAEIMMRVRGVETDHVLDLLLDRFRLRRRQIDLVEHRHDLVAGVDGVVDVGERLRLDALAGVDHQERALAGGERAVDLVGEVDVAGGVDQVEDVVLAVARLVIEPHGLRLDGDAALALDIHGIEHLLLHLARLEPAGELDQPVGQRGLAVVDMRDDGEIADIFDGNGRHGGEITLGMGSLQASRRSEARRSELIPRAKRRIQPSSAVPLRGHLQGDGHGRAWTNTARHAIEPPMHLFQPIDRLRAALTDPARRERSVLLALAAYRVLWTVYGTIAKSGQGLHPDMTELLDWSRHLAWGYKHPPLAAAIVRLWFSVFPVAAWSYYLLAMLMPTLTLWIVWRLSADYLDIEKRVFGLALLTLVPFFNFHALKFNVNTVLMPLGRRPRCGSCAATRRAARSTPRSPAPAPRPPCWANTGRSF